MLHRSLASLVGFALSSASVLAGAPEGTPPNIVIVVMDDVGTDFLPMFDELNPYSGDAPENGTGANLYVQAPNLQALADRGVTFTNAYAQPLCSPTRAGLLTGNYPMHTGVGDIFKWPVKEEDRQREETHGAVTSLGDAGFEFETLPQLLRRAPRGAYGSAIFGKWHLAMPDDRMDPTTGKSCFPAWATIGERGGFDTWRCVFNGVDSAPAPAQAGMHCAGFYNFLVNESDDHLGVENVVGTYATVVQFSDASAWCTSQETGEPFFCLITPNASHSPYQDLPPAGMVATAEYTSTQTFSTFTRFCASLEALDYQFGEFVAALDGDGLLDNTLIFVLGDNGTPEVVLEHARADLLDFSRSNACTPDERPNGSDKDLGATYDFLLGAGGQEISDGRFKNTVYEKGIRVPLIVAGPGVALAPPEAPGPRVSRALVQVEDIFPTIADMVDATHAEVDGISFKDILEDPSTDDETQPGTRSFVWTQRFSRTGYSGLDSTLRSHVVSCSLRLPAGRFKLVRIVKLGAASDEFYRLEDELGDHVDRFETDELTVSEYADERLLLQAKLAELLAQAPDGPTCTGASKFCVPVAGVGALKMLGSPRVACNDLVLRAENLVPGNLAHFFYGGSGAQGGSGGLLATASGASGKLCVGFPRYFFPAIAVDTTTEDLVVDLDSLPVGGTILPGDTWYFQVRYMNGAAPYFTNALEITFCP